MILGPGRGCNLAGWYTVAAHRGLNQVLFRGRVHGHRLRPGLYRLVPNPAGSATGGRLRTLGLVISARGIRPSGPVAWRDCDPAGPGMISSPSSSQAQVSRVTRIGAVDAASAFRASTRAPIEPVPAYSVSHANGFISVADSWTLGNVLLLILFGLSLTLLAVASLQPGHAFERYRAARAVWGHREQIALSGLGLLTVTALLFLGVR